MKRPTYYIREGVKEGETEFPPWTMIQPINDYNLPDHHREKILDMNKYLDDKYVMCIIGTLWVPVRKSNIVERTT